MINKIPSIIVTYSLIDSSNEQEKEFGAISAVAEWVAGIGEEMFSSISIYDGYDTYIDDFYTMHETIRAIKNNLCLIDIL